jgi:hypothetical protein
MTDENNFEQAARLLGGVRLRRATKGPTVAERTGTVVWRLLSSINRPIVLWNVFPFHSHDAGNAFSNRCHTRFEREITKHFFIELIEMIRPRELVAIGREAAAALDGQQTLISTVRHPSYGGQNAFIAGVERIYGVTATSSTQ